MRYRYLDDFRRGISVFAIFSYDIAVLGTPQCPPPNSKTKKEIKIRRHDFLEKLSNSKLAKFQPIGSRVADLEFKTYPQLVLIFISRKQ